MYSYQLQCIFNWTCLYKERIYIGYTCYPILIEFEQFEGAFFHGIFIMLIHIHSLIYFNLNANVQWYTEIIIIQFIISTY